MRAEEKRQKAKGKMGDGNGERKVEGKRQKAKGDGGMGDFPLPISCYASKLHDPGSEALAVRELAWKFR
jgi:hypothetical protein